ncbi:MAG: hypothetical protein COA96_07670 [SAR86 cluster bacterium]|uniref:Uncharacterized protein n=1 Tax=SAR86 cluster bacterium TaxID=2030880 RepID=A0A2A5B1E3_9GAMM|nr:MAG: hypothetical protein COA96_07670 [SAR86 cluster bacterium]
MLWKKALFTYHDKNRRDYSSCGHKDGNQTLPAWKRIDLWLNQELHYNEAGFKLIQLRNS